MKKKMGGIFEPKSIFAKAFVNAKKYSDKKQDENIDEKVIFLSLLLQDLERNVLGLIESSFDCTNVLQMSTSMTDVL